MDAFFTEDDRRQIEEAIAAAEAETTAEIVPFIATQSDPYPAARWRGGVLGALLALCTAVLLRTAALPALTPYLTDLSVLAVALGTGAAGAVTTSIVPAFTRALTPPDERDRAVNRRALEAFMEEEVFNTTGRTGILLFVSLLEHRIEVLADRGVDAAVDETAWADVAERIRQGIEDDRLTRGLLNGIKQCETVLDAHDLTVETDDENQLSDRLRRDSE